MEKLTIKTPSDVLSFIGHTLGFWPQESLVCITLNDNSIGATLRIDLPRQTGPGTRLRTHRRPLPHQRHHRHIHPLRRLHQRTRRPGQAKPHAGTIAALTGVLAEQGITIRDGLFVGDDSLLPLRRRTRHQPRPARQLHPNQRHQRRIHLPRQLHRTHRPHHPPNHQPGRSQGHRRRTPHGNHQVPTV